MHNVRHYFLQNEQVGPLFRLLVWGSALLVAVILMQLRIETGAEFAFASLVVFPVFAVAYLISKRDGLVFSVFASMIWVAADVQAGRQFSAEWVPILNGLTRFAVYATMAYVAAELREILRREYETARHDALTGLLNRRAFFESGKAETDRAKRYGHGLAIVFLDLDNFKKLNDAMGHEQGDLALKEAAKALTSALRKTDLIARLGGDEFAVILPEASFVSASNAGTKIAETMNSAVRRFSPISVSVGVAWFDEVTLEFAEMVKAADDLMYEVKQDGKHGVRCRKISARERAAE